MTSSVQFRVTFAGALLSGLVIGWIDSRPTWDDTGVIVGAIFIVTAFFGAVTPERPWLWALLVGGSIAMVSIMASANYGALSSLVIAFGGAYTGWLLRRLAG